LLPVTVIITAFERTAFLRGAIESVLAQRLPPREIVVCDDSSSPAIRDICAAFGDRLEYRANPQSLGVAATVREAILAAKHPFVAILNDDDCWEPHFLGTLVPALLDHRDCVLSFGDHWIMDEAGCVDRDATERNTRLYGRDRLATGQLSDTADLVLLQNAVPLAMSAVFRHEGIDWSLVTPEVGGAYDFWVTCLLSATGRPFAWSPVRVSRYRIHGKMETAPPEASPWSISSRDLPPSIGSRAGSPFFNGNWPSPGAPAAATTFGKAQSPRRADAFSSPLESAPPSNRPSAALQVSCRSDVEIPVIPLLDWPLRFSCATH